MNEKSLDLLKSTFGYQQFRGQQADIIDRLVNGEDALVLMPTGGGKSLCYQIPAMLRQGTGIVISPLIALMQDQVDALNQSGVRAACLNSTMSIDNLDRVERSLLEGSLDLLYLAPERLSTYRTLNLLDRVPIALFAIDEAHCVSQWGHDFRVDYLKLSLLHEKFPQIPRVALTATANERTRQEIIHQLKLEEAQVFVSSFDRPNIYYHIEQKVKAKQQLLHFIQKQHADDSGIVYCLSRKKVESIAQWLVEHGINAFPYHAGLPHQQRTDSQRRFIREEDSVVVATIAFGMGIDKPNIRFVAHLDLPKSIEAYYQETGRAGRDGQTADAWMVYGLQDVITLRQMIDGSTLNDIRKRVEQQKLESLLSFCEQVTCRRQSLLHYFNETLEQPCGNCDCCKNPAETWDGTLAAQQALSCIYRTEQRFGVNYLIDVLLGKMTERIKHFYHDRISTFGIGKDLNASQWRSVFRQLVAKGLISVDVDGHGSLQLTDACRPVLRSEMSILLRKDHQNITQASSKPLRKQHSKTHETKLWNALREKRKTLANDKNLPPYMIFQDTTLMQMVELKPSSLDQMSMIVGIGKYKLEHFGDEFLQVIQSYADSFKERPHDLPETVLDTVRLFKEHGAAKAVSEAKNLASSTIWSHLAQAIGRGLLSLQDVIEVTKEEILFIESTWLALPDDQRDKLKPLYEALDSSYDYETLRCIKSSWDYEKNKSV
ncbi:MAG: DNA helicase RecQ [Methylococcaceae bacterium]